MSDSPTPEPKFVCDCADRVRSACLEEPFYKEHLGKRYCVLHFPNKSKGPDFEIAVRGKLQNKDKDLNFRGVWFPAAELFASLSFAREVDFTAATFSAAANFSGTTFNALAKFREATFSTEANFEGATFGAKAKFSGAIFKGKANFREATFKGAATFSRAECGAKAVFSKASFSSEAYFSSAVFSAGAYFNSATFSQDTEFINCTRKGPMDFWDVIFKGRVEFEGSKDTAALVDTYPLSFQYATIEKPEQLSFRAMSLHPHWFLHVDASKFDFVKIHWRNKGKAKRELRLLQANKISSPHHLLAIACRRLAANAEANYRYPQASDFRLMAMDAERLETWQGLRIFGLNWWYWLASGYGERPLQALLVLLGIVLLSALLYNHVGFARWEVKLNSESDAASAKRDEVGAPLKFTRALTYSAAVMTLQKPEPLPATTCAQTVVLLETILGPVQAALLALAIRRKFMR